MTRNRTASLLLMVAGFVIWASAFSLLYGALSLGCTFGWTNIAIAEIDLNRVILLAIWTGHLLLLTGLLIYCLRLPKSVDDGTSAFTRSIAIGSAAAALIATVWTGLAIPAVSQCV